uniref:Cytochrome P450 n=1 Tax=Glossina brevipalpis TaxID=37001 RepID=A0A1A9WV56_9MUSC
MSSIQLFVTLTLCAPLLASILIFIYHLFSSKYWQSKNLPFIQPTPLFGNLRDLLFLKISFGEQFLKLHKHPALSQAAVGGIYILNKPALLLRDPELIQLLLIKNFHTFRNRYEAADQNDEFGALTLALAKYPVWRASRLQLCKVFTSGQLRDRMYPLMLHIAEDLEKHILKTFSPVSEAIIEVKELCSLFTTDLTSLVHFGVHSEGLKNGHSEVRQQTIELFKMSCYKAVKFFVIFFLPHFAGMLRVRVFPQSYMEFIKKFTNEIRKRRHTLQMSETHDLLGTLLRYYEKMSGESVTNSVCVRKKSATEDEEYLKNQRRTLQIVQVTATDGKNLTGRPIVDKLNRLKSNYSDILTPKCKETESKTPETQTNSQCNIDDHEAAKKTIIEKDLTSTGDKLSEYYWERLAIRRQEALDVTLEENQQLQERIECLRGELVTSQKLFEEAKNLVELLKEILNDKEEEQAKQKDAMLFEDDETNSSITTNSSSEE